VRNRGTTIEGLAPEVKGVTVPVLEVVVEEEEQVGTGVRPNQQPPDGEVVRPTLSSHVISLTCQKRVLQLL